MADKDGESLNDIAAELYALPPEEFTAARNARAKDLSDSALAKQVRALRKPLLAAWVVNIFAAERADELGQALELAGELRAAQADLDAQALTKLTRQRRGLIRGLAREARELAQSRGERITQATADAVEQTLNAAMFDPDAAAAVASGRLIRPLETSASYPLDDGGIIAGTVDGAAVRDAPPVVDEVQARRARKAAERLEAAEKADDEAEQEAQDADEAWRAAGTRARELDDRQKQLEQQLDAIRREVDSVRQQLRDLEERRTEAAERRKDAQRALQEARANAEAQAQP